MATHKEENIKLAEIAAEITKELIKANPKVFDKYPAAINAFKGILMQFLRKLVSSRKLNLSDFMLLSKKPPISGFFYVQSTWVGYG